MNKEDRETHVSSTFQRVHEMLIQLEILYNNLSFLDYAFDVYLRKYHDRRDLGDIYTYERRINYLRGEFNI